MSFDGRFGGNTGGIGTHVSDQSDGFTGTQIDTLVKLLGDDHRLAGSESELADGLLLQFAGSKRRQWIFLDGLFLDFFDHEFFAVQLL